MRHKPILFLLTLNKKGTCNKFHILLPITVIQLRITISSLQNLNDNVHVIN